MALRYYKNGPARELAAPLANATDTSITVTSASGFPSQFPYTIIIDPDQPTEEVCDVTAAVGNILTIVRGVDSTTAVAHAAGADVYHGVSARDHREANEHVNATTNVHGRTGSLLDTDSSQTISGLKDFTGGLRRSGSNVVDEGSAQTITGQKTFGGSNPVLVQAGMTASGALAWNGTETHGGVQTFNAAETHNGTETHNGAMTVNNNLTVTGTFVAPTALYSVAYSGTTDANGFLTITHGGGFTPVYGWTVTGNPASSFAVFWGMDTLTGTTVRVRFMNGSTAGPLASLAVTGRLFLARP